MLESFNLRHDFTPVPDGQRRYIAAESAHLPEMQVGTSLVAQGHLAQGRFSNHVNVTASDADDSFTVPKRVFLAQPTERRKPQSAEEKAQIRDSESARNEHIVEMSRNMSEERAEEIIRAVLAAIYGKDVPLPANPFRNDDTFAQAVAVVKAADLNDKLHVAHVPHYNEKGKSSHIALRENIRTAVARLMGMKEHQE